MAKRAVTLGTLAIGILLIAVASAASGDRADDFPAARRSSGNQNGADHLRWFFEEGPGDPWIATTAEVAAARGPRALDLQHLIESVKAKRSGGSPRPLTPILIVPSLLGSVLETQLHDFATQYWYCLSNWDWFQSWFPDTEQVVPYMANCYFERMSLEYNRTTGHLSNKKGVSTRIVDYGGVEGVAYLDAAHSMGVWNRTIKLFSELGWTVGKNLRAAPYDWRFSPVDYMTNDFPRLKQLFEEMYEANNKTRVAAVSLSMGGPYFLSFLNNFVDQQWKDTYIESWSSFDGAFGGSVATPIMMLTARQGWTFLDATSLKHMLRTYGSMLWMLPWQQVLGDDYVVVKTLKRSYTASQLYDLLVDAGATDAADLYALMQSKGLLTFQAPGVATYVFYGDKLNTTSSLFLNTTVLDDSNPPPITTDAEGDGVVLLEGLRMFDRWQGVQKQPIAFYGFPGMEHGGSVSDVDVLRMFVEVILGNPEPSQ